MLRKTQMNKFNNNNKKSNNTTTTTSTSSSIDSNSTATVIRTTDELNNVCTKLSKSSYITADTEFVRDTTYWAVLCSIQIADRNNGAYIIDPLSLPVGVPSTFTTSTTSTTTVSSNNHTHNRTNHNNNPNRYNNNNKNNNQCSTLDLTSFKELMINPSVTKVFHACRQDIDIFYHKWGIIPQPLFDTQIAAMVLGYKQQVQTTQDGGGEQEVSYDTLVSQICKVQIDKSLRMTDWSIRPLSNEHLIYALTDVTYLRDIYDTLLTNLITKQRYDWFVEEMVYYCTPSTYDLSPELAYERISKGQPPPRNNNSNNNNNSINQYRLEFALLQAVAAWREREAQTRNQPRRWILKDELVHEIVKTAAAATTKRTELSSSSTTLLNNTNSNILLKVRGLSQGFINSAAGKRLVIIIDSIFKLSNDELPTISIPTTTTVKVMPSGSKYIVDLLKVLLRYICNEHNIASKIIIKNSDDLEAIILYNHSNNNNNNNDKTTTTSTSTTTTTIPAVLKGWRNELFGQSAIKLLQGRIALTVDPMTQKIKILDLST